MERFSLLWSSDDLLALLKQGDMRSRFVLLSHAAARRPEERVVGVALAALVREGRMRTLDLFECCADVSHDESEQSEIIDMLIAGMQAEAKAEQAMLFCRLRPDDPLGDHLCFHDFQPRRCCDADVWRWHAYSRHVER